MICSPETRAAPNFTTLLSYSMETLLQICDDQDSNIRMTADECLNRIIRTVMDSNIVKVHVELHKEIKKNGSARSLRAALWRFAELAHLIRPNKGKLYIQSLVPCLMNIAKRKEESVLETLAAAIPKIFSVLGNFTTDKDIITLLRVFFGNISNENAVVRRTAATSIIGLCLNCPKTQFFLIYTLNTLLEMVLPVKIDESPYTILGVLNCIRGLLGHLNCEGKETIIRGSFGAKRKDNRQAILSADTLIQVYELCLNWTHHSDHNIVTAALETLNQLLSTPPPQFLSVLLSSQGLTRSRIQASSSAKLSNRNLSKYFFV
ncbi:hypothetical protein AAG570_009739 [Ranatra chinensis]|uniref:Huntingtin n=1 Tax=Ranatra chinensis TaxID=642074 RepID=A0ABD0ZD82_9HEMI